MPAVSITVPSVGESITEGILARWLNADGSLVTSGEPLFELETDKASSVVPAPGTGVLKIGAREGETVAIGATIGTIEPAGRAALQPSTSIPQAAPGLAAPAPVRERDTSGQAVAAARPPLSPAVRRLVAEGDLDVASISPTGPGGRITKGDVIAHLEAPQAREPASQAPAPEAAPVAAQTRETRKRMSTLRQRIAERLVQAQQTAAILSTFNEADMSRVLELRAAYKESFQSTQGVGLGFMSFFVKAVLDALKAFPAVNARIDGTDIVYQHYHDIGVAVSTDRGLVVPVIRDAERLSFAAIEKAIARFASQARDGTISLNDLQGGTFTITNGGVFGSLLSTPILNPPQSAILGMHAIKKRPVAVGEQIAIRPMMYLALSYDHRLIDGREAVGFLVRVKDCIENPERMLLEI
jgi:2-oxoglutarate dehydrogenase E2 component (dihydrolipoamide succinyltransferase)